MAISSSQSIRALRIASKIKQCDLAQLAAVPLSELSKCERGLVVPHREFFAAVAKILSVTEDSLIEAHTTLLRDAVFGEGYITAAVHNFGSVARRKELGFGKIPIVDLFCGVGGFSHGFESVKDYQVTAGLDLLPDRVATFSENHPTADVHCADITQIDAATIFGNGPTPEVIIGGPPCQGFSSIRPFRTLTEKDPRNNLFENFALSVECLRPKWFVMENVVGLITHQQGQTLENITALFKQIGYRTEWRVLNAAQFGLPQRRERFIMVGTRTNNPFGWPKPSHHFNGRSMAGQRSSCSNESLSLFPDDKKPAVTVMEAISDLPAIEAGCSANYYRNDVELTEYERLMRGTKENILTLHDATNHSAQMLNIIRHSGSNRSALPEGLTSSGFSSSYSRLEPDAPSVTLTVNFVHPSSNKCIHPYQDRGLTPREGARLQGFEDGFRFRGNRAQIIKQIGNAVPPLLGQVIAQALSRQL